MVRMIVPPKRGFAKSEFERRTARAQEIMHRHAFDALLLTAPPNVRYFTGFDTQFWESPTRPWFVVVPLSGAPIAVIPEIGGAEMATSWLKDIRTWPAPRPEDDGTVAACGGLIGPATPLWPSWRRARTRNVPTHARCRILRSAGSSEGH